MKRLLILTLLIAPACSHSSVRDRQDTALKDPMNYTPTVDRNVSSGGITDFKSDALKKDLNSVFNP